MPNGLYRRMPLVQKLTAKLEPFLDLDSSEWPSDEDPEIILAVKTKRDIQRDVDRVLGENAELAEKWESAKDLFRAGGEHADREEVLRPIYTILREKYSEEDLSS